MKIRRESYEPPLTLRVAGWLALYGVAQLPLFAYASAFLLFPLGLPVFFSKLFAVEQPGPWASHLGVGLAYGFYLMHLAYSLLVREKKIFWWLMVLLIVALALNTTGCMEAWNGVKQAR